MRFKSILAFISFTILFACGTKVSKDTNAIFSETKGYVSEIDGDKNLKTEVTEGALTDIDGFKDIGSFKYTVYFDENTNELFKIKNIEKTSRTITETYYFQDSELVYLQSISGNDIKNIYLKKGRVISETNTNSDDQQLLLAKAKQFQKAFKNAH
jgi:hypothetical protein